MSITEQLARFAIESGAGILTPAVLASVKLKSLDHRRDDQGRTPFIGANLATQYDTVRRKPRGHRLHRRRQNVITSSRLRQRRERARTGIR